MTEIPFYYDWTFWSAFSAIIALIVSLYPHVISIFSKSQIEVEVQNKIGVTHKVGNPNIWMFISIRNVGGKRIKLKSLSIILKRGEKQWSLPSPNYFETTSSQSPVLFIPRELKPGDSWEHGTNFVRENERTVEQRYRKAESLLRANIQEKRANLPSEHPNIAADQNLVDPLINMFNERFIWEPGEYTVELNITTTPTSASHNKFFQFTLFDSDSEDLKDYIKNYRFGAGIYYHDPAHTGLIIPIHKFNDD